MSSRTGLKRVGHQRLTLRLAALCGPTTTLLELAAKHPSPAARTALDTAFAVVGSHRGPKVETRNLVLDGPAGALAARLFEPDCIEAGAGLLAYFHGGGFVLGSIESHANTCRFIAAHAGCRVLSVAYRQPPEAPFPAAFDDALAAYRWTVAHASDVGAEPLRIGVGGDSAGGNLAAAVALAAADDDVAPCFAWIQYPVVDGDLAAYPSARSFADRPLLTLRAAQRMLRHYVPDDRDRTDPRFSVTHAAGLSRMPPTYIATAGMDPLRDQGERFAEQLRAAGVAVEARRFEGLPHGFELLLVDREARAATAETCSELARGLNRAVRPTTKRDERLCVT
ncbi:MAG TPA: alpha/beta hydrolase [Thermoleophilaceae bacterium]|nr:alpha/beta hydrolase [Thermoleophilaceae bacterium]